MRLKSLCKATRQWANARRIVVESATVSKPIDLLGRTRRAQCNKTDFGFLKGLKRIRNSRR